MEGSSQSSAARAGLGHGQNIQCLAEICWSKCLLKALKLLVQNPFLWMHNSSVMQSFCLERGEIKKKKEYEAIPTVKVQFLGDLVYFLFFCMSLK